MCVHCWRLTLPPHTPASVRRNMAVDAASGLLMHGSSALGMAAALLVASGYTSHQYMAGVTVAQPSG